MPSVFGPNDRVAQGYTDFSCSLVKIAADDLRAAVDKRYANGRYTPDPLISHDVPCGIDDVLHGR